jgi:hypothetical protein
MTATAQAQTNSQQMEQLGTLDKGRRRMLARQQCAVHEHVLALDTLAFWL